MKILIIYDWTLKSSRNTIGEYLWSFKRYSGEECYYLNVAYGIPGYISKINFDLVLYHFTFFDPNIRLNELGRGAILRKYKLLKELKGYKVAIPQDEYRCSDKMNDFFRDFGIKTLFSSVPESEWYKIYPRERSGLDYYFTIFTGYIDKDTAHRIAKFNQAHKSRPIDVGYRGSNPPYWLGRAGLMKWQLTEKFLNAPVKHKLKLDLSNHVKDIFYGDDWYKFQSNCRVVLGCEGGATLHDPDGSIKKKVDEYVMEHRGTTFEEVERACFPGLDGNLKYLVLSPRAFDACMTRTCQALIEGEYGGILKPGVHYIEIKKDWSNIADVIKQIEDVELCEHLAENAYRDIVESGFYTYQNFVQFILNHVKKVSRITPSSVPDDSRFLRALILRERFPWLFSPVTFIVGRIKEAAYRTLLKLNLYEYYKKIEFRINKVQNGSQ
jgi:hypothetical protein